MSPSRYHSRHAANTSNLSACLRRYNKSSDIEETIFQICSIIGVVSGVFIGALVVLGIVTGGAALAALGVIGLALAAVGGIVVLIQVFEGAEERSVSFQLHGCGVAFNIDYTRRNYKTLSDLWHLKESRPACVFRR